MPTFGYDSPGASPDLAEANNAVGGNYALSEAGNVSKLTFYCRTYGGTGNVKCAVYSDSGGAPADLLAESSAVEVDSTPAWRDFPLSVSLSPGTYWLCFLSDVNIWIAYDSGSSSTKYVGATYPTFPDPFGSPSTWNGPRNMSIYATYTTGATVQTVTDSLSLSDSSLRHKALLLISDSAALTEAFSTGKVFAVIDSLNLADVERALKELQVHDASSLADAASTVSRILQVSENVSVVEVVQVGGGGVRKTRLFLILGDLALQLT